MNCITCVLVKFHHVTNSTYLLFLLIDLWGSEGGSVSDCGSLWSPLSGTLLMADGRGLKGQAR